MHQLEGNFILDLKSLCVREQFDETRLNYFSFSAVFVHYGAVKEEGKKL